MQPVIDLDFERSPIIPIIADTLPLRLKKHRRKLGLSMRELAARCGTSQQQIDRLEKGQRRITLEWLARISMALECQVIDLVPEILMNHDLSSSSNNHKICQVKISWQMIGGGIIIPLPAAEQYVVQFMQKNKCYSSQILFGVHLSCDYAEWRTGADLVFVPLELDETAYFKNDNPWFLCSAGRNNNDESILLLKQKPIEANLKPLATLTKVISDAPLVGE